MQWTPAEGELAEAVGDQQYYFKCKPVGSSICVCVYTNNSIKINKNGKKLRCFNDGMSHLTGTPRIAKDTGRHTGAIKTRMWIKLPITHWALLEQIRTHAIHPTFEDEHETMAYCIMQTARKLGLETG